jgi:hypothetical protein
MKDNKFNFFVGCDIPEEEFEKASNSKGEDRYKNMTITGLASDDSQDSEGQQLLPSGYDFNEFLSSGLINLEHFPTRKADPSSWIGEPVDAYVKGEQFFIKAKLWEHQQKARDFYDTILAMKKSGSKRRAGFSIEGKSIEKDPWNKNKITKAKIRHCAVTFAPVNSNSWLDIAKGKQEKDYIEPVPEITNEAYIMQYELEDGSILTVNKDLSIKIDRNGLKKTVTTESHDALTKESLDPKEKNLQKAKFIIEMSKKGVIEKSFSQNILRKIFVG